MRGPRTQRAMAHGLVLQDVARSLGLPVRRLAPHSPRPQQLLVRSAATSKAAVTRRLELPSPKQLLDALPLNTRAAATVHDAREAIGNVLAGQNDRLVVIVGPCSIHDVTAAHEYASRLLPLRQRHAAELEVVMRVYFEKPRTTVGWKGLINDPSLLGGYDIAKGLRTARQLLVHLNELGLPCGVEFLDLSSHLYFADAVAWGAIGARTTESQVHREMVSALPCPIGFKNSTGGDVQVAIDAMQASSQSHHFIGMTAENASGSLGIIESAGNPNCHIVLRGGSAGPNFDSESVAAAAEAVAAAADVTRSSRRSVMVDCSHANSQKQHERQLLVIEDLCKQLSAGSPSAHLCGVMIESHINAGSQPAPKTADEKAALAFGVSITDACIDFESTERALGQLADAVKERRRSYG
jgi:3-deoxy-7-phosphoheptulonate synthase